MKEIKILTVKEITTRDGKKFNVYKTAMKNGKLIDLKFTRNCRAIPDKPCIVVTDDYNVDTNRQYPCCWIRSIVEIKDFPTREIEEDIL